MAGFSDEIRIVRENDVFPLGGVVQEVRILRTGPEFFGERRGVDPFPASRVSHRWRHVLVT